MTTPPYDTGEVTPPPLDYDEQFEDEDAQAAAYALDNVLRMCGEDLRLFVVWPSPEAADAVTLWVAATHAQPRWEHASRLVLKSPVKRCGKTRAAEVIRELVARPLVAGSISAAALVRTIDANDPPTLILDEADTVFGRRAETEAGEALRQILNLGHSRGWPYVRWDVKARSLEECPTFAMALIAGIGDLPDTVEDRAIVVVMQRRGPGESVSPFRQTNISRLREVRGLLQRVVPAVFAEGYTPPVMPVEDRAADVWEPLLAVAEAAGGDWPERARRACLALVQSDDDQPGLSERLLTDLFEVWGQADNLSTAILIGRLCELDEAPWAAYFGRTITPRDLARLLRPFGVRSRTVRLADGSTAKGYSRADLWPIWAKYTHVAPGASHPSHPSQPSDVTSHVTIRSQENPVGTRDVTAVTDVTLFSGRAHNVTGTSPTADTMTPASVTADQSDGDRCHCGNIVFAFTEMGVPLCERHLDEGSGQ